MIDQVLLLLQALFLAFLFLFIWMVVRSGRRDLRLAQESFVLAPAEARRHGLEHRRDRARSWWRAARLSTPA